MNRDTVIDILRREKPFLEKECGLVLIALFGSAARDQMTETSDVDLLVEFTRPFWVMWCSPSFLEPV
ncbi:MAG: hypothetical protein FJY35_10350 [Betaproteobacteria bacterium]|nr:hypothetical protein [Betaproteobacteria bacterium]